MVYRQLVAHAATEAERAAALPPPPGAAAAPQEQTLREGAGPAAPQERTLHGDASPAAPQDRTLGGGASPAAPPPEGVDTALLASLEGLYARAEQALAVALARTADDGAPHAASAASGVASGAQAASAEGSGGAGEQDVASDAPLASGGPQAQSEVQIPRSDPSQGPTACALAALRALAAAPVTAAALRESGLGRRARVLAKRAQAAGNSALAAAADAVVAAWRARVLAEERGCAEGPG